MVQNPTFNENIIGDNEVNIATTTNNNGKKSDKKSKKKTKDKDKKKKKSRVTINESGTDDEIHPKELKRKEKERKKKEKRERKEKKKEEKKAKKETKKKRKKRKKGEETETTSVEDTSASEPSEPEPPPPEPPRRVPLSLPICASGCKRISASTSETSRSSKFSRSSGSCKSSKSSKSPTSSKSSISSRSSKSSKTSKSSKSSKTSLETPKPPRPGCFKGRSTSKRKRSKRKEEQEKEAKAVVVQDPRASVSLTFDPEFTCNRSCPKPHRRDYRLCTNYTRPSVQPVIGVCSGRCSSMNNGAAGGEALPSPGCEDDPEGCHADNPNNSGNLGNSDSANLPPEEGGERLLEVRYALVRISMFSNYTTYEIMKSSKKKPKKVPDGVEGIFVTKR